MSAQSSILAGCPACIQISDLIQRKALMSEPVEWLRHTCGSPFGSVTVADERISSVDSVAEQYATHAMFVGVNKPVDSRADLIAAFRAGHAHAEPASTRVDALREALDGWERCITNARSTELYGSHDLKRIAELRAEMDQFDAILDTQRNADKNAAGFKIP